MSTFVLVHGAWHGGWCWHKVAARLDATGHRAIAPDMPGHGSDPMPIADVTMDDIVGRLTDVIDSAPEPVVLVGHSYGGAMITQAAERRAEKIKSLVYVAAYLIGNGESAGGRAREDTDTKLTGHVVLSADGKTSTVRPEALRECFYAHCSDEDVALARRMLGPEAMAGTMTPMQTSAERFGRLPRTYVECLQDRAVSIAMQRRLQETLPCQRVFTLDTDHSPFFSAPQALCEALARL